MKKFKRRNGKKNGHQLARREPEQLSLPEKIEQALIGGNLINLTPEERVKLYMQTCKSLKLNPMTKPFEFILMKDWNENSEKLILYATRNCTDQLRSVYGASDVPGSLHRSEDEGALYAEIAVVGRNGRVSQDLGVIPFLRYKKGGGTWDVRTSPRDLANAKMHVVTKARRRATLALYGLGGIVDESELDTMEVIGGVTKEGRIWRYVSQAQPERVLDPNAPHGHPAGSDKAKMAEAALARVEAADKEFQRGRQPLAESTNAPASKPVESGGAEGRKREAQPSATVDSREGAKPSLAKSAPSPNTTPQANRKLPDELRRGNEELRSVTSKTSLDAPNSIPQARIPHKITEVRWTSNSKGLAVTMDTGHKLYCFENHKLGEAKEETFNLLLNGIGKLAIFQTKMKKGGDGKDYMNITAILQLGDREWLEDGTPVLRRNREPGDE